jgi:hypothetical protein
MTRDWTEFSDGPNESIKDLTRVRKTMMPAVHGYLGEGNCDACPV